jgi:hypothetical protein
MCADLKCFCNCQSIPITEGMLTHPVSLDVSQERSVSGLGHKLASAHSVAFDGDDERNWAR